MPTLSVINTIQAAAADIVRLSGNVAITGCPTFAYEDIASLVRVASTAETLQVSTFSPVTAAAGNVYAGYIKQYDLANNKFFEVRFSYSQSAADTTTTICNAIRAELQQYINAGNLKVALTGTTTMIVTALTRYPTFQIGLTASGSAPATFVTGTPGVRSVNLAADVTLQFTKAGLAAPTLTGASYTSYSYKYSQNVASLGLANLQRSPMDQHTVFVDNTVGANYTAFNASIVEIQQGFVSAGTTVDPLLVSKPSVNAGPVIN